MKAGFLTGVHAFELREATKPTASKGEALIKIKAVPSHLDVARRLVPGVLTVTQMAFCKGHAGIPPCILNARKDRPLEHRLTKRLLMRPIQNEFGIAITTSVIGVRSGSQRPKNGRRTTDSQTFT
jgi:hypothetical protein